MTEHANEAVLRRNLLIQLSVLRTRYAALMGEEVASTHGNVASAAMTATSASSENGELGQSDRDAIEALFNSVDDFTRDFNEGKGDVVRGDLITKLLGS